ncbi:MAG TPA: diaminopimelate epimerase [Patescibacteria group bacterium]|nr:diaminopimelate epimerase [Patescibacteria group bacterium]
MRPYRHSSWDYSMQTIAFTKMVGSGNDFVVIDRKPSGNLPRIARAMCDRTSGIGADGMLLLEKTRGADIRMRIFNADGSEAEMCGNGARCVAFYLGRKEATIRTAAGIIRSQVNRGLVRIRLTDPTGIKLDVPVNICGRTLHVNYINTGVPHVVVFTEGLDEVSVLSLGKLIRFHAAFAPRGTNVNFIEVLSRGSLKIRTYERGVEDETLACGTGSVASALIFALKGSYANTVSVHTKSGEILKVYFDRINGTLRNVWLEGKAAVAFKGVFTL